VQSTPLAAAQGILMIEVIVTGVLRLSRKGMDLRNE